MAQSRARWIPVLVLLAVSAARLDGQSVLRQGVEFQVNSYTTNYQNEPAVDLATGGDFVVTWTSLGQDGDSFGVFGRRFNVNGVSQALEFKVNSYTVGLQLRPSVGLATGGAFVVAWDSYDQDDGSYGGVFARRFDAAGIAQAVEFQVNSYTPNYQARPVVAVTGGGDFVVVWQSNYQDGSGSSVFARRFNAAGVAQAAELQVNTYTTGGQGDPAVAIDNDGDFVVVWSSGAQDGSGLGVFGRRFNSAGAPQAVEFQVNAYTSSAQSSPTVAAQGNGAFVVAWNDGAKDGASYGVFARVFNAAGVAQATELQVNTYTVGAQSSPTAGVDASGRFVIAWHSIQDGESNGVFARRFDSNGTPLTGELQVNVYTTGSQSAPVLAFDGGSRFTVAWTSDGQDGFTDGVFAQRFSTSAILDIDGNGSVTALTDGLLVLRFLFGFTGTTLTTGAIGGGCTRCDAAAILPYLEGLV